MFYVMSDIHGELSKYKEMLKAISLRDEDTLYVLGDVIDRCSHGVEVLEDIMYRKNVKMLIGNHEDMCIRTVGREFQAKELWMLNGGSSTYRELMYKKTGVERIKIIRYLKSLSEEAVVTVGGQKYTLVHGWPGKTREDRLWGRPVAGSTPLKKYGTVVFGHTPTMFLCAEQEEKSEDEYVSDLRINRDHFKIFYGNNCIGIDCGCGNKTPLRRLACLRLDDMKEFYC